MKVVAGRPLGEGILAFLPIWVKMMQVKPLFPSVVRYFFFSFRKSLRNVRMMMRERLVSSTVLRTISQRLLPRMHRYSPIMCASLLEDSENNQHFPIIKRHLERCIENMPHSRSVQSAIIHALKINEKELAIRMYEAAVECGIPLSRSETKLVELAKGNFEEYMKSYALTSKKKWIKRYFPDKYVPVEKIDDALYGNGTVAIISTLGPGDEISFSSTYAALLEDSQIDPSRFRILCDHRLHPLLKRAFPQLDFVPSYRSRHITRKNPWKLYDRLPTFGMHVLMCNESLDKIIECDKFLYMHDLLYKYHKNLIYNTGKQTLRPDERRVSIFGEFASDKFLNVGLIWRSSVLSSRRNHDYLFVEDLDPLFYIEGVRLINLQYSITDYERAYLTSRFPGKFLEIEGLDLYDDFDSVAALIDNLDVIISPATMMAGLAAHVGKSVLLVANTLEVALRRRPNGRDVWHPNKLLVQGDRLHDRHSLVQNLARHIRERAACKAASAHLNLQAGAKRQWEQE